MNFADLVDQLDLPETNIAEYAWDAARRRTRRRRVVVVVVSVALILAVAGVSALSLRDDPTRLQPADTGRTPTVPETSETAPTDIDNNALTDHEFAVAVAVARQEVERLGLPITSATATVGEGTVSDSNTGHACVSGTLLHIKLIGDFHKIPHFSMPGQPYEPTSAVLLTADPESEQACLIGVSTGEQEPKANSVVLFTK
jgi:hypothetical protein